MVGCSGQFVNRVFLTLACAALVAAATVANAQPTSNLSADISDSRILAVQRKVDVLFEAGDFERSYFIYRNELAPLGDKYAQYMIGFMHVTGQGVAADPIQASAWYRLAAERDTPEFVAVRNKLMSTLTAEQVRRSDVLYTDLLGQYCDLAVLLAAIKSDLELMENRTGTRLKGDSSSVWVVDGRSGRVQSNSAYFRRTEQRIEVRLRRLIDIGRFEDLDPDPDRLDFSELERLVENRIAEMKP